ncbi:MAG: helix-turn-helix transcriptional regulator [Clostridia bacterium]|nr:helix-turn-helix transcriptional regulator [Clostridia bacterium]
MEFVLKNFQEAIVVNRLANVHYFEFTADYHTKEDAHNFCELLYVDNGVIEIASEHYTGELHQNQIILHGANEKHSLSCTSDVAPNVIIIGFECFSPELAKLTFEPLEIPVNLQKMLADIIKETRAVYLPPYDVPNLKDMKKRTAFDFGADQLIRDTLQIFLIQCLRHRELLSPKQTEYPLGNNALIYEIKAYLERNYAVRISVDELCFLFRTNKTTLCHNFKKYFGKTIIDYVNELRIEHTKRLLRENVSLTEIADKMDISSVHYLTTIFKKYVGMSPREYKRSIKAKLEV